MNQGCSDSDRRVRSLTEKLQKIGFQCSRCGECCRQVSPDSDLVIASPPEIRRIMDATGLCWDEVAEPYPEFFEKDDGTLFTFEWCIKRKDRTCAFLDGLRCTLYPVRPWICRTYPFMLDGEELLVFPCKGIGQELTREEAEMLAWELVTRQQAETEEEERVREIMKKVSIPHGKVVIDGEGIKVQEWVN
jgi:Predicted Fe-S-cluster oxidoreductase